MNAIEERYKSEYGWSINLPENWTRLSGSRIGVMSSVPAVKFAKREDWDIAFAWIVRPYPVADSVVTDFAETVVGTLDKNAAANVVKSTFSLVGEIDEARIAILDGVHALEVLESYEEDGKTKRGYQLIMPLVVSDHPVDSFQRLCFYAPQDDFAEHLADVIAAVHSFKYDSPYVDPNVG